MSETSDAATPWERRSAESAAAWRGFALYRDLGPVARRGLPLPDRAVRRPNRFADVAGPAGKVK